MKAILWMVVSAAVAMGMAAPASAGVNDPEVLIYRFAGVRDDGSPNFAGVATVFNCTNFSGASDNIRRVTRRTDGILLTTVFNMDHLATLTVATHATNAYVEVAALDTGSVSQGTTAVAATSTNIVCTAMTIDAATAAPTGVALRGIRFSPVPGSQE